jgi:DNA-directed RNA polymerase specialized sigma subunit
MDNYLETKIKGFLLRGFSKEEVSKMLNVPLEDVQSIQIGDDVSVNSSALFTDLQKDLAKLVLKEMQNTNGDGALILNAIKLQAELQDKKLMLSKSMVTTTKLSRSFVKDRDKEIERLFKDGNTKDIIAKKLGISQIIVERALDRCNLGLSDELWEGLDATVITETAGLDNATRLKILEEAYKNNYSKRKVRDIVIQIKNNNQ